LRQQGELEMIGGAYYITELTNRVASAANIEYHSRIIIQKYIQRELDPYLYEVITMAYEDTADVLDLLDKAEKNLFEIAQNNLRRDSRKMDDLGT
jgi:replicative DNA helicase